MEEYRTKISRIRKEKGLNQSEMGRIIGISQTAYAKIENGTTTNISIGVGKGIAKALNVGFNELFDIESENINVMKRRIDKLTDENQHLRSQLEDYQLLVSVLKQNNEMDQIATDWFGADLLISGIELSEEMEKKAIEEIKNNNKLRKYLEGGKLRHGLYYHVWEKHFKK